MHRSDQTRYNFVASVAKLCVTLTLILPAACSLLSCAKEDSAYFPLAPNRSWHYHVKRTTMDGTTEQKYITETLPSISWQGRNVVPTVTAGGETYLYAEDQGFTVRLAYKASSGGDFVAHEQPFSIMPKSVESGREWQQSLSTKVLENTGPPWETLFRINAPVAVNFKVASNTATVIVPAGKFTNCVKISGHGIANVDVGNYIGRTQISVEIEQWYAKGVGLVKLSRTEKTGADAINYGHISMELERYSPP